MNGKISFEDAGVESDAEENLLARAKGAIRRSFTLGRVNEVERCARSGHTVAGEGQVRWSRA